MSRLNGAGTECSAGIQPPAQESGNEKGTPFADVPVEAMVVSRIAQTPDFAVQRKVFPASSPSSTAL
ncbi:hypothetical protein SAMN05880582_11097 [Rhizobium sp. RU20A]|nr:hypothetical protein SAMN05880582_11097 [Rhizobium sp. RU20A]